MRRLVFVAAAAALSIACGGATVDPLDAGDGGDEAAPDANGSYECGKSLCGGGEICVHPCCGGAPPPCLPYDDAGVCPSGTIESVECAGGADHCKPPDCTPPPPYCAPAVPQTGCELQSGSRDCYEACA